MPISCLSSDGKIIISLDFDMVSWKELKVNYKNSGLCLKCCNAPAVPKTSNLGMQFFAHKSDSCGEGGESLEHLKCKELIIKAARKIAWVALPEEEGKDPEGNAWRADILCSNYDNKIVFEVQLASQTFEEYKKRTEQYLRSGLKCVWFTETRCHSSISKQMILDRIHSKSIKDAIGHFPDREDLPIFQIDVTNINNIFVFFPWRQGNGPFKIPLDDFVVGYLSGALTFSESKWRWNFDVINEKEVLYVSIDNIRY